MALQIKLVFLLLAGFLSGCAIKPGVEQPSLLISTAKTAISPELLKEELELIKQHLIDIHPQPFYRLSQLQFEAQFERLKQSIQYPLSRADFYLKVAPLLVSLKDAHSFIDLPLDSHSAFKHVEERLFPLAVIIEADASNQHKSRLYVAADLAKNTTFGKLKKQQKIPTGAEIIAINQLPVKHLLDVMRTLISQETLSGQNRKIQMSFSRLLAAMGHANKRYQIDYSWQGQQYHQQRLGLAIKESNSPSNKPREAPVRSPSYYGFSQIKPNVGLLWLNDFNQDPEVFKAYLADKFSLMQKRNIKHLILDLRFNSGGVTQNLTQLLSYLSDQTIPWVSTGNIRISQAFKNQHFDNARKRRKHKYNWSLNWLPLEWTNSLQYSVWWNDNGDNVAIDVAPVEPKNNYRPPQLYVLSNGFCFSACSYAQAAIKANKLGIIIGEQSGSLVDVQFAYPVKITLPHSQFQLTLPTTQLKLELPAVNELTLPDISIRRTQQDIVERRDPAMLEALKQIQPKFGFF